VIDFLNLQRYRDSMVAGLLMACARCGAGARAGHAAPAAAARRTVVGLNVEETEDMAFWIGDICQELGITVLMVEHDMTLVSKVSDRVVALNQGEVLATGTPRQCRRTQA